MQQSTKTEIIELTAAIISESRLFDAQLQEDSNPLPQEVDEDECVVYMENNRFKSSTTSTYQHNYIQSDYRGTEIFRRLNYQ